MEREDVIVQLSRAARIQNKWNDLLAEVDTVLTGKGNVSIDGVMMTEIYKTAYTNVFGSLPDGIEA